MRHFNTANKSVCWRVQELEEAVHREFEREVPSQAIGERVAARLRTVDSIAYIRYASEHHDFRTLDDFAAEVSELLSRTQHLPNQEDLFPDGV